MVINKEIELFVHKLENQQEATICCCGIDILVRLIEDSNQIALTTTVFQGDQFIPISVRECLHKHPPFRSEFIKTFMSIDETCFQIHLNLLSERETIDPVHLQETLEEFSWLTNEWRLYLDEHGRNDLIHVHS